MQGKQNHTFLAYSVEMGGRAAEALVCSWFRFLN